MLTACLAIASSLALIGSSSRCSIWAGGTIGSTGRGGWNDLANSRAVCKGVGLGGPEGAVVLLARPPRPPTFTITFWMTFLGFALARFIFASFFGISSR